jgi:uncharacterized repeat protein (TIGR03803 family)
MERIGLDSLSRLNYILSSSPVRSVLTLQIALYSSAAPEELLLRSASLAKPTQLRRYLMCSIKPHLQLGTLLTILVLLATGKQAVAQHETIIYNGGGSTAAVTFDASGNLYDTNSNTVFELTPQSGGIWAENTLYSIVGLQNIEGSPVFGPGGNIYSVTQGGRGQNLVFELTPSTGGTWTETTLYTFPDTGTHGYQPYGAPTFDSAGNLYGTTNTGGAYGTTNSGGTVYELSPKAGGGWSQRVVHSFGNGTDGSLPYSGVTLDSAGNIYGTTTSGGTGGAGTVFELIRQPGGAYREKILHSFSGGVDGADPRCGLIFDSAGNLYGTAVGGGAYGSGVAFELIPQPNGSWQEKRLHSFGNGTDGGGPYNFGTLIFDAAGNLYGTTFFGGTLGGGTAFELSPQSGGGWTERRLHNFGASGDGVEVLAGLTFDSAGNLYGTTQGGGSSGGGTVFEITP